MKFDSIVQYLAVKLPKYRAGRDIFINHMPAEAETGILFRHKPSGTPIDPELPGYRKTRFIMVTRSPSYTKALEMAEEVSATLNVCEVQLTGIDVRYIRPFNEPVPFMPSAGNLHEFAVTFDAAYVIL